MSGMWNTLDSGGEVETLGFVPGSTNGKVVTANASANIKGSYVELIASSSFDSSGFFIRRFEGTTIALYLLDIAIGDVGSEENIVFNCAFDYGITTNQGGEIWVPIRIPAGSRVSARVQCSVGSRTVKVLMQLHSRGFGNQPSFGRCTVYGSNTGDSGGTQVDPGSTNNTKGSYSQIVASTLYDIKAFTIFLGRNGNNAMANYNFSIDVGIGAFPETIILNDFQFNSSSGADFLMPDTIGPFNANIPAGTRISVRAQCSGTSSTGRLVDLTIHGFD